MLKTFPSSYIPFVVILSHTPLVCGYTSFLADLMLVLLSSSQ